MNLEKTIRKIERRRRLLRRIRCLFTVGRKPFRKQVEKKSKGICGLRGDHLLPRKYQIHHIYPKRNYPILRYEPKNGVCLCIPCHKFADEMNILQELITDSEKI